jgi:hypothetical protein
MVKQRYEPAFANMRRQGVRSLIAYCLNDACRHLALIDVSSYPGDVEVPSFQRHNKCAKCGGKRVDVGPFIPTDIFGYH